MKTVILDNGHGCVIGGVPQTQGRRSPIEFGDPTIYEGSFNRAIVNRIIEQLNLCNIPFYHVSPELADISLSERVKRANAIYKKDPKTYLLSIHANAGGGTGFEVFTAKGQTNSDFLATFLTDFVEPSFGCYLPFRKDFVDGDLDKEANFQLLTDTNCPAMLFECPFFDNEKNYKELKDFAFRNKLANCLTEFIINQFKKQ